MGEVKLSIDSDSIKDLFEDFTLAMEDLGSVVVKGTGELPEALDDILRSKGVYLYRPGEGIPDGLLKSLLDEEQEEVLDFILDNQDAHERLIQMFQEKGYEVTQPDKGDSWE